MNCKEIIDTWLVENGYDGLACPELECGCGIDDFMPCDCNDDSCEPAYYHEDRNGWYTDKLV